MRFQCQMFYIVFALADTIPQSLNRALLTLMNNIFRSKPDIKNLAGYSTSTPLIIPIIKFEAISSKDVGGVKQR